MKMKSVKSYIITLTGILAATLLLAACDMDYGRIIHLGKPYEIELKNGSGILESYRFPDRFSGYLDKQVLLVVVKNSGSNPTGALTVALDNKDSFAIVGLDANSQTPDIRADGAASFTVTPNAGFYKHPYADPYTTTITVSNKENGIREISESFKATNTQFCYVPPGTFKYYKVLGQSALITSTITKGFYNGEDTSYAGAVRGGNGDKPQPLQAQQQ